MSTKQECIRFAEDNLNACASEILEWRRKAILSDGKTRELAELVAAWIGQDSDLQVAEQLVIEAALKAVANSQSQTAETAPARTPMSWTNKKPVEAGAYWVRGWEIGNPDTKALVELRGSDGCLLCNLHQLNTSGLMEEWESLDLLSDEFEWYGPLK